MSTENDDYVDRILRFGKGQADTQGKNDEAFSDPAGQYPRRTNHNQSSINKAARGGGGKQLSVGGSVKNIDLEVEPAASTQYGMADIRETASGHVIELDDGNYAIQPNNRLRIFDPSMAADPSKPLIHRLVNTKIWSVEDTSKWITDENEEGSYDYDYKEMKDGKE